MDCKEKPRKKKLENISRPLHWALSAYRSRRTQRESSHGTLSAQGVKAKDDTASPQRRLRQVYITTMSLDATSTPRKLLTKDEPQLLHGESAELSWMKCGNRGRSCAARFFFSRCHWLSAWSLKEKAVNSQSVQDLNQPVMALLRPQSQALITQQEQKAPWKTCNRIPPARIL